jgi:hypothetical protein
MDNNDKPDFAVLMTGLAEVCANANLTREKIDMYFQFLRDLDIETVRENAKYYIANNKSQKGFFPPVAFLRDPREPGEIEAEETALADAAFSRVKWYIENFYYPEMGASCMAAIECKMKKANELHLLPLLNQWGGEILSAPTQVVRSQFVKSLKGSSLLKEKTRLLSGKKEPVQIGELIKGFLA